MITARVSYRWLLSAVLLSVASGSISTSTRGSYRREHHQQYHRRTNTEIQTEDVDFDGKLEDLFALAYEQAAKDQLTGEEPAPTMAPIAATPTRVTTLGPVAPVTLEPSTSAPVTLEPSTSAPVTLEPSTSAPVTLEPSTAAPVTLAPTTSAPVTPKPTTSAPTTSPITPETPMPVATSTFAPFSSLPPVTIPPGTTNPSSTVIDCGSTFHSVDVLSYRYALEYEGNIFQILYDLEADMNQYIALKLMSCKEGVNDIGLVAIDSRPPDQPALTAFCETTHGNHNCRVIDGQMRIFVALGADADTANYRVRVEIRNYLNAVHNNIPNLYSTSYLAPDITEPAQFVSPDDTGDRFTTQASTSVISTRSIILFCVAGIAFVGAVGLAAWFKSYRQARNQEEEIKDEPPALAPVPTTDTDDPVSPLSPFSKMLPAAYRLDDPNDMSVILELRDEVSSNDASHSIILSESGFSQETTTDDIDLSNSRNKSLWSVVLGAKKRKEERQFIDV